MHGNEQIIVSSNRRDVAISRSIYEQLLETSIARRLAPYERGKLSGRISLNELKALAQKAEIPWPLFFGTEILVNEQIRQRDLQVNGILDNRQFPFQARGEVNIGDIVLLIRNLQRKQELFKKHKIVENSNSFNGFLKKSLKSLEEQGHEFRTELNYSAEDLWPLNKGDALSFLIDKIELRGILVAEYSKDFMPQSFSNKVRFSGFVLKDPRMPFIYVNGRDETDTFEPIGRRIFTLTLLASCIAKAKYRLVSYSSESVIPVENTVFELTEEILMPRESFVDEQLHSLNDVRSCSDKYCVTPTAVLVRATRLNLISRELAISYHETLAEDFRRSKDTFRARHPKETTGFKKFNGLTCSTYIYQLLDSHRIDSGVAKNLLFHGKIKSDSFLEEYRSACEQGR